MFMSFSKNKFTLYLTVLHEINSLISMIREDYVLFCMVDAL